MSNAPDILGGLLQSNDGLARMADLFSRMGGRELSSDALQVLAFLQSNGSPDLAEMIVSAKMYQLSVEDLTKMTREISSATAHEKMLEAQAKLFKQGS